MLETGVLKHTQNGVMGPSGFGFVGLRPFFPPPLPTTDLTKVSGKLSGDVPHVDTSSGVEPPALDHRRQPHVKVFHLITSPEPYLLLQQFYL